MKLYYVSGAVVPSTKANPIHVMKMCQAFARQPDMEVSAFVKSKQNDTAFILDYYHIKSDFALLISPAYKSRILTLLRWIRSISKCISASGLPDVLYSRHLSALLLLRRHYVPFVFEAHRPAAGWIEKWMLEKLLQSPVFLGVVVISNALKTRMHQDYPQLTDPQVFVAPDGADVIDPPPAAEIPLQKRPETFQVGYIGTVGRGRGIEIIGKMAQNLPAIDFHVIGGRQPVQWNRSEEPGSGNLHFYDFIPPAQIPSILQQLDVLLAPYQKHVYVPGGYETTAWMSPMKIFEYLAAAKPIIASDLPVIREILTPNETALLVPCDEVQGWIVAIRQLQKDPALRKQLGQNGLDLLQKKYTWQKRAESIQHWIESRLASHRPESIRE